VKPLKLATEQEASQLQPMRTDTYAGMEAAESLRPFASELSFLLFSFEIIGTGRSAVPILAGSGAYALAETLKWLTGLDRPFHKARGFYGILSVATLLGSRRTSLH